MTHRTPVIVGVGQVVNRECDLDAPVEPLALMREAIERAEADTGTGGFLREAQSIRVIRGIWRYANPAGALRDALGASGAETLGTLFGGNQNQAVMNMTARQIRDGELDLAILTGAETGYTQGKARKAGVNLTETSTSGEPDIVVGAQKPEHHDHEIALGIRQAIQVYPMYENAIRHARGESMAAHMARVSGLWSRFSDVASGNPNAWLREPVDAETIRTPTPGNRRISFPYTKLMNANMMVDMGAALIVCSTDKARALGIPEDRWVYPVAGAQGYDHFSASVRWSFTESPGIRLTGRRVLELAECGIDDIRHVDLYSCFPSAVQVAAAELGLAEDCPLTVTGGLTFGGGPLNNYVMHSIARTVELLREAPADRALVTANGGNLYKHVHGVYSGTEPAFAFREADVQADIEALPARSCLPSFDGEAKIESYTVMFGADGPAMAHIACLTPAGERCWVNSDQPDVMDDLCREEFCGRRIVVAGNSARDIH